MVALAGTWVTLSAYSPEDNNNEDHKRKSRRGNDGSKQNKKAIQHFYFLQLFQISQEKSESHPRVLVLVFSAAPAFHSLVRVTLFPFPRLAYYLFQAGGFCP